MEESRKPADTPFKQQRLKAWQPILSPRWVIGSFVFTALFFIPIGAAILAASSDVQEVQVRYDDQCTLTTNAASYAAAAVAGQNCANDGNCTSKCTAQVSFTLHSTMKQPIYMYYKLVNFYQNHRRYAASRSDAQLSGSEESYSALEDCSPVRSVGDLGGNPQTGSASVYDPCGLIAWSMFNDTLSIGSESGGVVCQGNNPTTTTCVKNGIAWKSDVDTKFKAPSSSNPNIRFGGTGGTQYSGEPGHALPDVTDEDFIVWMRTASLPTFRKLYRIIQNDLTAGTYTLNVTQQFPVASFDGEKWMVLSTTEWIGGKNVFLGSAYLVVGCLCAALAVLFGVHHWKYGRQPGEPYPSTLSSNSN